MECSVRLSTYDRSFYDDIVTINIGPKKQGFGVHKALLCNSSSYFKAALAGSFKEAKEGVISLEDEDPDVFGRFVMWLYSGYLLENDDVAGQSLWSGIINILIFAERRDIPHLHNDAINTYFEMDTATKMIPSFAQRTIWKNTFEGSLIRKVLVDHFVYRGNLATIFEEEKEKNQYDHGFVIDVCIAKHKSPNVISTSDFYKSRCQYHIHKEGEPRCNVS